MKTKTSQYRVERQFNDEWHEQGVYRTNCAYDAMLKYCVDYEISDATIRGLIARDKLSITLVK